MRHRGRCSPASCQTLTNAAQWMRLSESLRTGGSDLRRENLEDDVRPWSENGFTLEEFQQLATAHPEGAEVQMLAVGPVSSHKLTLLLLACCQHGHGRDLNAGLRGCR